MTTVEKILGCWKAHEKINLLCWIGVLQRCFSHERHTSNGSWKCTGSANIAGVQTNHPLISYQNSPTPTLTKSRPLSLSKGDTKYIIEQSFAAITPPPPHHTPLSHMAWYLFFMMSIPGRLTYQLQKIYYKIIIKSHVLYTRQDFIHFHWRGYIKYLLNNNFSEKILLFNQILWSQQIKKLLMYLSLHSLTHLFYVLIQLVSLFSIQTVLWFSISGKLYYSQEHIYNKYTCKLGGREVKYNKITSYNFTWFNKYMFSFHYIALITYKTLDTTLVLWSAWQGSHHMEP